MKRKTVILIAILACFINVCLLFSACNDKDADSVVEPEIVGTELKSTVFEIKANQLYCATPNVQTDFSFADSIQVAPDASFDVYFDIGLSRVIRSKKSTIEIGDNVFYILVTNGEEEEMYTAVVRRKPIYKVTFETNAGYLIEPQYVEEGGLVSDVNVQLKGYNFKGWDYDFAQPITKDMTICASLELITYSIQYITDDYIFNAWNAPNSSKKSYNVKESVVFEKPYGNGAFLGWYINDKNGEYVSSTENLTEDLVLYAWFDTNAKGNFYLEKDGTISCEPDNNDEVLFPKCNLFNKNITEINQIVLGTYTEMDSDGNRIEHTVKTITFPDSVEAFGSNAIGNGHTLETIRVGKNLTTLGRQNLFYGWLNGCTNLQSLIIDSAKINDFNVFDLHLGNAKYVPNVYVKADADVYDVLKKGYTLVESDKEGYVKYHFDKN